MVLCAEISSLITSTFISRTFITDNSENFGEHNSISMSNSLAPLIFAIFTTCLPSRLSRSSLETRYSATVSNGSMVADIPILCTGLSRMVSSNAIVNARCTPLFVGTRECISSIISHSTFETIGWNLGEDIAIAILSGVVIRIWGGFRSIFCLSDCGVSPVLNPTLIF
ncbi:MAG: Uncharacterised protein [Methanobacteriota archaeon]|nr:MAG: Uncharacterised protein [Euryarchaeota archaeon]